MQKFSQIGKNTFKDKINGGFNTVNMSVQIEIVCVLLRPTLPLKAEFGLT